MTQEVKVTITMEVDITHGKEEIKEMFSKIGDIVSIEVLEEAEIYGTEE